MKLADRSPGTILVIGAAILCTQILFEIGIWLVSPSLMPLAVAFCMVTAISFALFIMWWFHGLLSDGGQPYEATAPARTASVAAPQPQPAARRKPAFKPALHH